MQFPDGQLPSKEMIKKWLNIVDEFFSSEGDHVISGDGAAGASKKGSTEDSQSAAHGSTNFEKRSGGKHDDIKRIGVHCLAGLGRAPFFVAMALVNNGCSPQNAIDLIRKNRPGALNLA